MANAGDYYCVYKRPDKTLVYLGQICNDYKKEEEWNIDVLWRDKLYQPSFENKGIKFDINKSIPISDLTIPKPYSCSNVPCLLIAFRYGSEKLVQLIISLKADLDVTDHHENTALHESCRSEIDARQKIGLILNKNGASLSKANAQGTKPIHVAALSENLKFLLPFCQDEFNSKTTQELTPLHIAAHFGIVENLKLLLQKTKIAVNSQDVFGDTAAHHAASQNYDAFIILQNDDRFDKSIRNQDGHTAEEDLPNNLRVLYTVEFLTVSDIHSFLNNADQTQKLWDTEDQNKNNVLHVACRTRIKGGAKCKMVLAQNKNLLCERNTDKNLPLHIASGNKDIDILRTILESGSNNGVSVNAPNRQGMTALHIAVSSQIQSNVELLLENTHTDVNVKNTDGDTPSHIAARQENTKLLQLLRSQSNYKDIINNNGETPDEVNPLNSALLYHVTHSDAQIIKDIINKGAKAIRDNNLNTPLHLASKSRKDRNEKIVLMLQLDPSQVNKQNKDGQCPLHLIILSGDMEDLKTILASKCDITMVDYNKQTPFHYAAVHKRFEMLEHLLQIEYGKQDSHGNILERFLYAKIVESFGKRSLHTATGQGYVNIVKLLIKNGWNVNAVTHDGETALHMAAENKHIEVASVLLRNGCLIYVCNKNGETALHLLLKNVSGQEEDRVLRMVDLFLQYKCNVNAVTMDDTTALHLAAQQALPKVVSRLLTNGCLTDAADRKGRTALHHVVDATNNLSLLYFFKERKEDRLQTIELLLQHKCDAITMDKNGETPLDIARRQGQYHIVVLLTGTKRP